MYYHATLIYAAQALFSNASGSDATSASSTNTKTRYSYSNIIDDLNDLTKLRIGLRFAQDLVRPLFIAGTEMRGDRVAQEIIKHKIQTVMHISRTLDTARVLAFLRSWWESDGNGLDSWIEFSRMRSEDYNLIIV